MATTPALYSTEHFKSDERILGDSGFVESVLRDAGEELDRKYRLRSLGYDYEYIRKHVSDLFKIPENCIEAIGKEPHRVRAKSVIAYWAVRELGMSATAIGKKLQLTQSAVSRAVQRGEMIVAEMNLCLEAERNA